MVKLISLWMFWEVIGLGADLRFRAESLKKKFYEGESVPINFVVYAEEERIDVEVMRFPEFRGFWSENFILKQGPIQLLPSVMQSLSFNRAFLPKEKKGEDPDLEKLRRSIVGSYSIQRMLGRKDAIFKPMKLLVRRPLISLDSEIEIESELPLWEVLPLPPIPKALQAIPFLGAVGNFVLRAEGNEVLYRKGEAATFRLSLLGEGNFTEINQIPMQWMEAIKPLGAKSYLGVLGGTHSKAFEFSLEVDADGETLDVPSQKFLFFDPGKGTYIVLETPIVHFAPMPKEVEAIKPKLVLDPQVEWHRSIILEDSILFWISQVILSCVFGWIFLSRAFSRFQATRALDWRYQGRKRWKKGRHTEGVVHLTESSEIILQVLEGRFGKKMKSLSLKEMIRHGDLSDHERREIQFVFDTYGAVVYGKKELTLDSIQRVDKFVEALLKVG